MPVLHNRVNNEELKQRMLAETEPRKTVSFYKYFHIADPAAFRNTLRERDTVIFVDRFCASGV